MHGWFTSYTKPLLWFRLSTQGLSMQNSAAVDTLATYTRVDPTYLANHEELTNEVVEIDLEYMELYDDKALQNRDVAFIKNGAWSPVHYGGASLVKVKSLDSNPSRPNHSKKRPIFGKTDCF